MANPISPTRRSIFLRLKPDSPVREMAWNEFYELYQPLVRRFAMRLGLSLHDADDVVQEVMTGFFKAAPGFVYEPGEGGFRAYLRRSTFRAAQSHQRRERRLPTLSLDADQRSVAAHRGVARALGAPRAVTRR